MRAKPGCRPGLNGHQLATFIFVARSLCLPGRYGRGQDKKPGTAGRPMRRVTGRSAVLARKRARIDRPMVPPSVARRKSDAGLIRTCILSDRPIRAGGALRGAHHGMIAYGVLCSPSAMFKPVARHYRAQPPFCRARYGEGVHGRGAPDSALRRQLFLRMINHGPSRSDTAGFSRPAS